MTITPKLVRFRSGSGSAGFNRLLLHCQFDYRQRVWNLPALEASRDRGSHSVVDSAKLAAAVSKIFLKLSEAGGRQWSGARPVKITARLAGLRRSDFQSSTRPTRQRKQAR